VVLGRGLPDDEPESVALERMALGGRVLGGAGPTLSPEAALEDVELRATIIAALGRMPEQERAVILLAYRDGLSQSEIAQRLGWPLGTVKTRTRRALSRLRRALGGAYGPAADADGGLGPGPGAGMIPIGER
jgi:RNA polymerase sigma factor (sigma-70 family)